MVNVDFRRIAILDRRSIALALEKQNTNDHLNRAVGEWGKKAVNRGMDACYLRLYNVHQDTLDVIARSLSDSTSIIVPYSIKYIPDTANGVHFRENDKVEAINPGKSLLRGKSCHSLESVKEAEQEGLDYVFFSPIFETATHPGEKGVGLDMLHQVCNSTTIAVFALGGINEENYKQCLEAGALGIAALSMFME